jgi:hypothetical protein
MKTCSPPTVSALRRSPRISDWRDPSEHGSLAAPATRCLLYIAGYGRSGSTLFGRLLAQNEDVLNLGEVVFSAGHMGGADTLCGCGRAMAACPVWTKVPVAAGIQPAAVDRRTHRAILEAVLAAAPHRIVVDVSKTARSNAFRPFFLARHLSVPVTVVHLVRDPRAVLWSVLRERARRMPDLGTGGQLLLALRISAAWWAANLAAELFGLLHPRGKVLVGYERALRSGVPAALQPLLGDAPLQGRDLAASTDNNHSVAGNAMPQATIVRLDEEWRSALSPFVSMVVQLACLPLLVRYGLLRRPRAALETGRVS